MSEEINQIRKAPKKVLGRGLGSLLGEAATLGANKEDGEFQRLETLAIRTEKAPTPTAQGAPVTKQGPPASLGAPPLPAIPEAHRVWKVPVEKLQANREQPRKAFEQEKLSELAASIKERGILLPILARRTPAGIFEIIAGERRWRAAQLAGLSEVPVLLRESDSRQALEEALIENVQRHDLNPLEEAEAYQFLAAKYQLTQQQIAEKMGKDRTTIANLMRLSVLPTEVKDLMRAGEIHLGQAKVILGAPEAELQIKLARKAARLKLSVRALEKLIQRAKAGEEVELENDHAGRDIVREIRPLVAELQRALGTKVEIDSSGQRTKVSFQFYSIDELNQFVDKIRKAYL